jgi:hypothetical protein
MYRLPREYILSKRTRPKSNTKSYLIFAVGIFTLILQMLNSI